MEEKCVYNCRTCNGTVEIHAGEAGEPPECCGQPMQQALSMDQCVAPASSEHSRFDDEDQPCDDGRAG